MIRWLFEHPGIALSLHAFGATVCAIAAWKSDWSDDRVLLGRIWRKRPILYPVRDRAKESE